MGLMGGRVYRMAGSFGKFVKLSMIYQNETIQCYLMVESIHSPSFSLPNFPAVQYKYIMQGTLFQ